MKVAIIVFSPNGNTFKVSKMLEKCLLNRNILVQLINITRKDIFDDNRKIVNYLKENVQKHDLLCIGSPVYAHHLHYNIKNLIKFLPKPDNIWSKLVIPFITYGGLNSGIALYEAAKSLKKSERIIISGMKIDSFHCWTKRFSEKINEGLPGDEALVYINDLVDRIINFDYTNYSNNIDITKELNYQNLKVRIKAKLIFREKFSHSYVYPKLVIDRDKCTQCGKCTKICPVQRLELKLRFKLTQQSLENLRKEGISEEILRSLNSLEDQQFTIKKEFVVAVKEKIGTEQTARNKKLILENAQIKENDFLIEKSNIGCIHCQMCSFSCSSDAIYFDTDWSKWEKIITKSGKGLGPLPSNEYPKSAVYPIYKKEEGI